MRDLTVPGWMSSTAAISSYDRSSISRSSKISRCSVGRLCSARSSGAGAGCYAKSPRAWGAVRKAIAHPASNSTKSTRCVRNRSIAWLRAIWNSQVENRDRACQRSKDVRRG